MRSHKQAVEAIVEIEKRFDVTFLRYKDLKVWPLIRIWLWFHLIDSDNKVPEKPVLNIIDTSLAAKLKHIIKFPFSTVLTSHRIFKNWKKHNKQLKDLSKIQSIDILFISRFQDNTDQIQGKCYNRNIDPLIELSREYYKTFKVEHTSLKDQNSSSSFESSYSLFFGWQNNKNYLKNKFLYEKKEKHIVNFDYLVKVALDINEKIVLREEYFVKTIRKMEWLGTFYLEILSVIKPKAIFFVNGESRDMMTLIWICKKLGITTAEIQHGQQGKYNGKYSHWTKLPIEGFELLPDYHL